MDGPTPEFLRWSIRRDCALREGFVEFAPAQVERWLRSLRTLGEAARQRRELDGVCFPTTLDQPPGPAGPTLAFRASDALDPWQLAALSDSPCRECPAHVVPTHSEAAGCFGLVDWTSVAGELHNAVDAVRTDPGAPLEWDAAFVPTTPAWYGLWCQSPLSAAQLTGLAGLLERLLARGTIWAGVFGALSRAIAEACQRGWLIDVEFCPAGRVTGRQWEVTSHCARCKAAADARQRLCPVCGWEGLALPARRRLARGNRPWRPLAEFLSPDRAADLVRRYLESRGWPAEAIEDYARRTSRS